jgi:membrane protease YdiL (CAAX protease family)
LSDSPSIKLGNISLPLRPTLAAILATLLFHIDWYYDFANTLWKADSFAGQLRNNAYDHVALYLIIPLLIIVLVFRQRPSQYGFQIGDWRLGLKLTAIAWGLIALALLIFGRGVDVREYYLRYYKSPQDVLLTASLELIGWEFIFRGFLLFALWEVMGPMALVVQAMPFALMHHGKPFIETLSTVFSGIGFGWVAWQTKSYFYAFLIHLFISTFIVVVALNF